jgi:hypothetical protein
MLCSLSEELGKVDEFEWERQLPKSVLCRAFQEGISDTIKGVYNDNGRNADFCNYCAIRVEPNYRFSFTFGFVFTDKGHYRFTTLYVRIGNISGSDHTFYLNDGFEDDEFEAIYRITIDPASKKLSSDNWKDKEYFGRKLDTLQQIYDPVFISTHLRNLSIDLSKKTIDEAIVISKKKSPK